MFQISIIQKKKIKLWKKKNYSIGVANGCFDLLHRGHIHLFQQAKKKCNKLIVLLNSDKSVKLNKGSDRPIEKSSTRKKKILKNKNVDEVILFNEKTPLKIIKKIKPNFIFKGKDYKRRNVSGYNFIKTYGGKVVLLKLFKNYSTTLILKKKNDKKINR